MGKMRQLRSADGYTINAYEALPVSQPLGSIVVIQEIFGVNSHIREVADGFAENGYATIAPQIFDRAKRDVELGYSQEDIATGLDYAMNKTQREDTLKDLQAAVEEIGKHGMVGIVGYCFGGLLSWLSACKLRGLSAAVIYYGGGIVNELSDSPRCPVMMHFGELDAMISLDDVANIRSTLPDSEIYTYPADHGFNCNHRDSYHDESAQLARTRTVAFFENLVAN